MRTDMVMPIGSITKTFTKVLQLVDEGKLTLDHTLDGPAPQDTSTWSRSWGWAGGGRSSTLADLHTCGSAIGHGATLSNDAFVSRLTQVAPSDGAVHYGLGVNITSLPNGSIAFHTGQ